MAAQIRKQAVEPSEAEFDVAAGVLKLLADPTRLKIVWALLHGEHSVNELADHVGACPPPSPSTSPNCEPPTWSAPAATATASSTPHATNTSNTSPAKRSSKPTTSSTAAATHQTDTRTV